MITATIHLRAPLAHGSFSDHGAGNATLLRREPVVSLPGAPRVPCVSGNALRGVLRREIMRGLFDVASVSRGRWADVRRVCARPRSSSRASLVPREARL